MAYCSWLQWSSFLFPWELILDTLQHLNFLKVALIIHLEVEWIDFLLKIHSSWVWEHETGRVTVPGAVKGVAPAVAEPEVAEAGEYLSTWQAERCFLCVEWLMVVVVRAQWVGPCEVSAPRRHMTATELLVLLLREEEKSIRNSVWVFSK